MRTFKKKRLRESLALMVVLALVLSLMLGIAGASLSAVGESIVNADVNYDENYNYTSMLKTIEGSSVSGNTVSYNNGKRDTGGDGVNQWSYFPTKYLDITEPGEYNLSGLLHDSVTSGLNPDGNNSPRQYNTNASSRFIGIERRGYVQLTGNNNVSNNVWSSSSLGGKGIYHKSPWGHNTNGDGTHGSGDFDYRTAFYFTIKVPGNFSSIKVGLDAAFWGSVATTARVVNSALGVYEVNDPKDLFGWSGGSSSGGLGFNHDNSFTDNGDRVTSKLTGGTYLAGTSVQKGQIKDGAVTDAANQRKGAVAAANLNATAGSRYITVVIANDLLAKNHGGMSAEYLINNLRVTVTGRPNYELASIGNTISNGLVRYEGANAMRNGVAANRNEVKYGGSSQHQYLPTQYLIPNEYNTQIDLVPMMKKIIGNSQNHYPGGTANRLFGIEEHSGKNNAYMSHPIDYDKWGNGVVWNDMGDGISVFRDDSWQSNIAFYFTMALPDHMIPQEDGIEVNWSFDTRTFGEKYWKSTGFGNGYDVFHHLGAGYAIYADTMETGAAVSPQAGGTIASGFDHGSYWGTASKGQTGYRIKEDKTNGLVNLTAKSIFAEDFQNKTRSDNVNVTVKVPKNTRFLRFVVAFDQDEIGQIAKVKHAISNMKVSVNDTNAKANPGMSMTLADNPTQGVSSRQFDLRVNPASPIASDIVKNNITVHAIKKDGSLWSSKLNELPTAETKDDNSVVWRVNDDLGVQTATTDVAGVAKGKTTKGIGSNTKLETRANRVWVTYKDGDNPMVQLNTYKDQDIPMIDVEGPSIEVQTPIRGQTVDIKADITDALSSITKVVITGDVIDGEIDITNSKSGNTYKYNTSQNGTFSIKATDALGNSTTLSDIRVNCVDRVGPTIGEPTISYIENNHKATISVVIADNDTDAVTISGPGIELSVPMNQSGTTYTYTTSVNGTFTIHAKDNVKNESSRGEIVVDKIDTAVPTITLSDPQFGLIDNHHKATITVTVTDNASADGVASGLAENGVYIEGQPDIVPTVQGNAYTFTVSADGDYVIKAKDKAENIASQTVKVSGIDNEAPTINSHNVVYENNKATITVAVADASNLESVVLKNNTTGETIAPNLGTTYTFTVDANDTYKVIATDIYGNATDETYQIAVSEIGNSAPTISIAGNGYEIVGTTATITATITDDSVIQSVTIGTKVDGVVTNAVDMTAGENGVYTYATTSNGTYTITATDTFGNTSTQDIIVEGLDAEAPTADAPTFAQVDKTKGTITIANVNDNSGKVTIVLTKAGSEIARKDNVAATNSTYTFDVTENGAYVITITDAAGNTLMPKPTVEVNIDKTAPTIPEDIHKMFDSNKNTYSISFQINENDATVTITTPEPNSEVITLEKDGFGKYKHTLTKNGTYTITAKDKWDNTSTMTFTTDKIDDVGPTFNSITGNENKVAIDSKTISLRIIDDSREITQVGVTLNGASIEVTGSAFDYQFVATNGGTYIVTATDKWGNKSEKEIVVNHIITAGTGVVISDVTDNSIIITRKLDTYNTMLGEPTTKGKANKVYNFGIEAKYTITYDLNQDVSETIDIPAPAKMLSVNVDGVQNSVAYGTSFTLTAATDKGKFVGWYNERGGMVSTSPSYTIAKVVTNMTFTAKYVTPKALNVTFVNISGGIIDVKSYDDVRELATILASKNGDYITIEDTAYMTFSRFKEISNDGKGNVVIRVYMTTEQQFNVTIDGVTKQYYYNQPVTATGATNGWGIEEKDGTVTKVTSDADYRFYVMSDIKLVKLAKEQTPAGDMTMTATKTTVNSQEVISMNGFVSRDKTYTEVGFVFANNNANLTADNFILENVDTMRISVANNKGGQYILNVDATAFDGVKVRMYMIDSSGGVTYSRVFTLSNVGGIA